ncbi:MAG: oxidoreductase, 2OG-Fe(II) oxygenase [Bacteroidetes bacterium]|nr:MAG: oxidoreductase, 2OG-Fe(II) oxygenase [Bacteroidota bacterium]TAG85505.1 MAG: oxidoreductase, 2OG-Fe(II) oxygenase [Bacteroidota bacterium]
MKVIQVSDKIIVIENFFSDEECQKYIDLSENLGYEVANIDTGKIVLEVRNNERVFYKSEDLAQEIYGRAKPHLPSKIGNSQLCGLNELFRFYKYQKGHRFKGHQDGNFIRNETEASYLTFMIYLNEGYEGGHTIFREHNITPKKGMALIFHHKLYHEGDEVLSGIKYVLRSDVMYQLEIKM